MRDIFFNQTNEIGSHDWLIRLTEAEQSEWSWIQNNIDKVNKLTDEFGLKQPWNLGRVLYALSFNSDDYAKGYAEYEDALVELPWLAGSGTIYRRLNILHSLLHEDDEILRHELKLDEKTIHSEIAEYQELLDIYNDRLEFIKVSHPKRYNYRTAVLRRVGFLFYQMKKEGQQANISIRSVYMLYHTHKFADYYEDENYGYDSPLFKRIQEQRNQALKHFKHRLTKSNSPKVENTAV